MLLRFSIIPLLFSFFLSDSLSAQETDFFTALEQQLQIGQKRSLRDLATVLDEPGKGKVALQLLKAYSLFTSEEILLDSSISKARMINFYYDNFENINFSPLLSAFYITPVEERNASYDIKKKSSGEGFDIYDETWKVLLKGKFSDKDYLKTLDVLIEEVKLSPLVFDYLPLKNKIIETLKNEDKTPPEVHLKVAELLTWFHEESDLQLLLQWMESGKISSNATYIYLARLTNLVYPELIGNEKAIAFKYRHLLDSMGSVRKMILTGYQEHFGFTKDYFPQPVHYFGRIMSEPNCPAWILQNAVQDLKLTYDPAALLYIAGKYYGSRVQPAAGIFYQEDWKKMLERMTDIDLAAKYSDGATSYLRNVREDELAMKNFLFYWANRYEDFNWNKLNGQFENEFLESEERNEYDLYFRQLTSPIDSIALSAYDKIAHGNSGIIQSMIPKYRDIFPELNSKLPPWRYQTLEKANLLYKYDKKGIEQFNQDKEIQTLLSKLSNSKDPIERLRIENLIILNLPFKNVSGMEYWGLIHAGNPDLSISSYRIIRNVYLRNIEKIWAAPESGSLFAKKAQLFQPYQNYWELIENDRNSLRSFFDFETELLDPEFRTALEKKQLSLQIQMEPDQVFEKVEELSDAEIGQLPKLRNEYIHDFFDSFLKLPHRSRDPLKAYLVQNLNIPAVPYLMDLLAHKEEKSWAVVCLNRFFEIPAEGSLRKQRKWWQKKWKDNQQNTQILGQSLWKDKLELAKEMEKTPESLIQRLVNSPFYQQEFKKDILYLIARNENIRLIQRLNFSPLLESVDLNYLAGLDFDLYALDNLPEHFRTESYPAVFDFIFNRIKKFGQEEQALFFSDLLKRKDYLNYLPDSSLLHLKNIFTAYLDQSDFITEGEEKSITWYIFSLGNKDLNSLEKLKKTNSFPTSKSIQAALQYEILARIKWNEIPDVLTYWPELISDIEKGKYNFLNTDFGIPIMDLKKEEQRKEFMQRFQNEDTLSLYKFYLNKLNLGLFNKNGEPDLNEMANFLETGPDYAFAGRGGYIRDFQYFAIIKFLEYYFKTDLGFHPKLNENQTFIRHSINNRAKAWLEYLAPYR
ncbi:MAG: hypothetical protein R2879_14005 [Saprospiraceae bacterium]